MRNIGVQHFLVYKPYQLMYNLLNTIKNIIKKFVCYIIDMISIIFIVMLVYKSFVTKLIENWIMKFQNII